MLMVLHLLLKPLRPMVFPEEYLLESATPSKFRPCRLQRPKEAVGVGWGDGKGLENRSEP